MHLWAEACNTAIFVQSRCPHRILGMSTPEEAFIGKKTEVSHFKIFGSSVYVHVTKDAGKKMELTAEVGIFVGYTETPHNYHVYFPNNRMNVVRQDIKFDEEKSMCISHMRRFMEWRKTLMQNHPSEMVEGAPQKLID